jgi:hypothetical protein
MQNRLFSHFIYFSQSYYRFGMSQARWPAKNYLVFFISIWLLIIWNIQKIKAPTMHRFGGVGPAMEWLPGSMPTVDGPKHGHGGDFSPTAEHNHNCWGAGLPSLQITLIMYCIVNKYLNPRKDNWLYCGCGRGTWPLARNECLLLPWGHLNKKLAFINDSSSWEAIPCVIN